MQDTSLRQLYEQHQGKVSDKWSIYLAEYDRLFSSYRSSPVHLLEIGVQNGGSLEIWSKYFSASEAIVGCDINPDCAKLTFADSRVTLVVGDANTDEVEALIAARSATFDLIIDDGSHTSGDIVRSFARYFPRLRDGGLFVAEDLHCSYWAHFQGGLFHPTSSVAFFKRLADIVSHEHWGVPKARKDILANFARGYDVAMDEDVLAHIHSVEFINSMCVIRKAQPQANILGPRFIAGTDESVVGGHGGLHLTMASLVDERGNPTTACESPEGELVRLRALKTKMVAQNARLDALHARLVQVEAQRVQMAEQLQQAEHESAKQQRFKKKLMDSVSWRATAPVRWLTKPLYRLQQQVKRLPNAVANPGSVVPATGRRIRAVRDTAENLLRNIQPHADKSGNAVRRPLLDYSEWLKRYDTLDQASLARMRARIEAMPNKPLISIIMPTYNSKPAWLREAVESVQAQIYPHWELCIADDASPSPETRQTLAALAAGDSRIKVVYRQQNGHIAAASNSALEFASGEWIALMDHDDVLPVHALFWVAHTIDRFPDTQLIYSDEDKIDESGMRCDPYFKSDWNPDLFYSHNMYSHLGVYRTELVRAVGGFRLGTEGSQDYDLVLRCSERVATSQIRHIPKVLYSWRVHAESTAKTADAKPYAMLAGERVLNEHFERTGVRGRVECLGTGYRAHYDLPTSEPLVSLIIPTRNAADLVRQCIDSILALTTYSNYEILLVDNGSDDPAAIAYFQTLQSNGTVRLIRDDGEFNYSALNNRAVTVARGEYVALVNNDIEVISPAWLSEMVSIAAQSGVGAVGAKLWYPDMTLQHGGVVLGVNGVLHHAHRGIGPSNNGYFGRAALLQSFSAVTAACLVVKKSRYQSVGGLNEQELKIAYNDVDFCLRLRAAGYRNVWTPYAELIHHESATRGSDLTPERQKRMIAEVDYLTQQWGALLPLDPAYNPNLTLERLDFSLAWPPREHPDFT